MFSIKNNPLKHAFYIVTNPEIFRRDQPMILAKNIKFFPTSFKTLKVFEIIFGDVLDRKQSFLDYKNMHAT